MLALGGGSWAKLGSDGAWVKWLDQAGVKVEALKPSNCGFDVAWSPHFRERFEGQPLKSVVLSFGVISSAGRIHCDEGRRAGQFGVCGFGVDPR